MTNWAFHRASSLGSHHQMPASYEAAWPLPRLDSHQLVVPSFASMLPNSSMGLPKRSVSRQSVAIMSICLCQCCRLTRTWCHKWPELYPIHCAKSCMPCEVYRIYRDAVSSPPHNCFLQTCYSDFTVADPSVAPIHRRRLSWRYQWILKKMTPD